MATYSVRGITDLPEMLAQQPLILQMEEAQRHHCDTLMLDAYVTNSAAHRFYFREGFHVKSFHFFKSL